MIALGLGTYITGIYPEGAGPTQPLRGNVRPCHVLVPEYAYISA